jgi:hypothetical protein
MRAYVSLLLVGWPLTLGCGDSGNRNQSGSGGQGGSGGSGTGGTQGAGGAQGAGAGGGGSGGQSSCGASGQIGCGIEGEMSGDQSGGAVALSSDGTRVVIGAAVNDGTANQAGHARVFERTADSWVQLGADLDGEAATDLFGTSVAISANGGRVAVGSYQNDGGGANSGNVRVFDYAAGAWTQVGADIDGGAGDGAGWAVDLSASGHRVVIGGPGVGSVSGDARVYELVGGAWTQVGATLTFGNEFAHAVTMSNDGNRIAVSESGAAGSSREGTVHVYDWSGTAWTPVGAVITGEALGDTFGTSLSFSSDGNMIAVGGPGNVGLGLDGGGSRGGHVRVYRFATGAWTQVGADLDGAPGDNFGTSVALSGDGTRLLAGGPPNSIVRYHTLAGDTWTQATAPAFAADARAGEWVAISADGLTAAVGANYFRGAAGSSTGVVRVYALP